MTDSDSIRFARAVATVGLGMTAGFMSTVVSTPVCIRAGLLDVGPEAPFSRRVVAHYDTESVPSQLVSA